MLHDCYDPVVVKFHQVCFLHIILEYDVKEYAVQFIGTDQERNYLFHRREMCKTSLVGIKTR